MNNKLFCKMRQRLSPAGKISCVAGENFWFVPALLAVTCLCPIRAFGSVPDWLLVAAQTPLPKYAEDTNAVVLLDEQITVVSDNGEIKTLYRRACKILRTEGRELGVVAVYFDSDTQLTRLKGWSIAAGGQSFEVKEKDAVETSAFSESLYQDTRHKALAIPSAEPGSVIGYEYEQKHRSRILEDMWYFQDEIPVQRARYTLRLPAGWEYRAHWANYSEQKPRSTGGNQWVWDLEGLPAIQPEPSMPPHRAIAGWMGVTYYPPQTPSTPQPTGSWQSVGLWFAELTAERRRSSAEIHRKVQELVSNAPRTLDKIETLAEFVQQQIRYVAIEIGIGGYQPHFAQEVLLNRYGDCKDKATLLSAMLGEIGVASDYVLVNASRGVVTPQFPTMLSFNHVILAIHLPPDAPTNGLWSIQQNALLGRLVYFDPTNPYVPIGYLPEELQEGQGLLIAAGGGQLEQLPIMPPSANRLLRQAKLALTPSGTLYGSVTEIRWGEAAAAMRARLVGTSVSERKQFLEKFLGSFLTGCVLNDSGIENLENAGSPLVAHYSFVAAGYAKVAGDLLLLRPRVLGTKAQDSLELEPGKERKYPLEYPGTTSEGDVVDIALPEGYQVDELPPPLEIDTGTARYRSQSVVTGSLLHYTRNYEIRKILFPANSIAQLKNFYRQIATDERGNAVLKRSQP